MARKLMWLNHPCTAWSSFDLLYPGAGSHVDHLKPAQYTSIYVELQAALGPSGYWPPPCFSAQCLIR